MTIIIVVVASGIETPSLTAFDEGALGLEVVGHSWSSMRHISSTFSCTPRIFRCGFVDTHLVNFVFTSDAFLPSGSINMPLNITVEEDGSSHDNTPSTM